ncbi:MAG: hypothetical protein ACKPKO_46405, partial [Candidatus Fonsibacter sp.]
KTVIFESHDRLVDWEFDVVGVVEPPVAYALLPGEQLSSGLELSLPYSECVRLDGVYVNPAVGQQFVGTVAVEVVVLHQQLLDVSAAACQIRLRIQVQSEEASALRDHLARLYHGCTLDALVEGLSVFHPDLASYCLMQVMKPPSLSWNT